MLSAAIAGDADVVGNSRSRKHDFSAVLETYVDLNK
jgi:hypothetical protein